MKMPVFRSFFRALMRSVCDFVGVDYCSAKDYKSSISSKSKCALRAVIAFFVASATLITTFVIAPSSALSASQDGAQQNVERSTNAQNNVQQSSAQNNSAQNGINKDEVKRQVNSYEPPNSPEPPNSYGNAYGSSVMADGSNRDNKKEDAHGSDNASSKDKNKVDANVSNKVDNNNNINNASKDDEKLNNDVKRNGKASDKTSNLNNKDDSNKAGNSAKLDNKLEKSAKRRRVKRALSGGEGNESWRNDLAECKKNGHKTFAECYWNVQTVFRQRIGRRTKNGITYTNRGKLITSSMFKILKYYAFDRTKETDSFPQGTTLEIKRTNESLHKYEILKEVDAFDWFYFKGENGKYNTKTTNKILAKDISIGYFSSKWMNNYIDDYDNLYIAIIEAHYPDNSVRKYKLKIGEYSIDRDYEKITDSPMNVYESEYTNKDEKINKNLEKSGYNVTRISTQDSDGNYSKITPIFIESTSEKKFDSLRHFMVCHKEGSDGENDYTLDNVNGLKLSGSSDGTSQNNEYESEHMERQKRPDGEKKNSGGKLYEDDDYLVQSRSWISGTPKEYGNYVCKVFVIRDTKILSANYERGHYYRAVKEFFDAFNKEKNFKKLFDNPQEIFKKIGEESNGKRYSGYTYKFNKDWDYKEIKIVVSDSPPGPQHGDLSLNVYPFKSNGGAAPTPLADNSTVSVMRRMELKPFIDATSDVDNNQITFKMLCSKGEVSGSTGEGANESTVADTVTSESRSGSSIVGASTQKSTKNLVYKNWSDGLITLNTPIVQCDSSKIGDKNCNSNQSAAQTSMTAQVNSNVAGDYKCVVYALKQDALEKFNAKFGAESKPVENGDTLLDSETDLEKTIAWNSFVFNIYISDSEGFSLPNTGERNWNLQLGAIAAVMVSVLAAAFILNHSNWQREQAALRKAAVPM